MEFEAKQRCGICSGPLVNLIGLPGLPLTDSYSTTSAETPPKGIDQALLYCPNCSHGQLRNVISPSVLYGNQYCFRTSASSTARKGTDFFLSCLEDLAPERRFSCVLDVGCNDLYLLERLRDRADHRVGVDPVWEGREGEQEDPTIQVFGCGFESIGPENLPVRPDLVVCRHTLEHISSPRALIERLLELAAPGALFLFEVPGFDGLIERLRFDQVFHQHLHYFSLHSFLKLIETTGAHFLSFHENYHDWGAIAIGFTAERPAEARLPPDAVQWSADEILRRYGIFKQQMKSAADCLRVHQGKLPMYGYGAAQMLPVLAYHMGTDLQELSAILDDDPQKDGLTYWNLPIPIRSSKHVSLEESLVMITAVDNVQPITLRLLKQRPRHLLSPLTII